MYVPVHSANGRTSRAPSFGLFPRTLAAPQGAPFGRHPAAEATARAKTKAKRRSSPRPHLEVVQGCMASWIPAPFAVPSIAGDGGKCPQGRARDVRASADSTRMYCQTTPPSPRSAGAPAAHDARRGTASGAKRFGYFMRTAPQERREQRGWPRSGEGQDARSNDKSNPLARRASGSSALDTSEREDADFRWMTEKKREEARLLATCRRGT